MYIRRVQATSVTAGCHVTKLRLHDERLLRNGLSIANENAPRCFELFGTRAYRTLDVRI